jgi:hypothetical protein
VSTNSVEAIRERRATGYPPDSSPEVDPSLANPFSDVDFLLSALEAAQQEIAKEQKLKQGYYNEAVKGWQQFRVAETEVARLTERVKELESQPKMSSEEDRKKVAEILAANNLPVQFTERHISARNEKLAEDNAAALSEARSQQREQDAKIAENYGQGRIYTAADAGVILGTKTKIAAAIRSEGKD